MEFQQIKISKASDTLIKVASIVGAIVVIAGAYSFYINNFYVPNVELVDVDLEKGTANIKYKNTIIPLQGDSTFLITGSWGVRFNNINIDGSSHYSKIELLKNGMVYTYLKKQ
jgi:copper chaperone CopZ